MKKNSKIYVAGHTGLLGSALVKRLSGYGYGNVTTKGHADLDLTQQQAVFDFFSEEMPEYVFLAAGKVGGIVANRTYRADFLHVNLAIQDNIFEAARLFEVKRLIMYGSSCVYPKNCEQPMRENHFLAGPIEETSEAYAAAKIAGIIACKSYNIQYRTHRFIALVPNSMYGPHDNFDLENAHVLSSLMAKFHKAKTKGETTVELWGSGSPRREFVYSEDVADASIFVMLNPELFENHHYNLGTGFDLSISELAQKIATVVGFEGKISWDATKPDGAPRKLLDSSLFLATGWQPQVSLEEGLARTYRWFVESRTRDEVKP